MEWSDRVAFMVIFTMGAFFCSVPFLNWEHKETVTSIIGGLMLTFCVWAMISDVAKRYRIVEVN